MLYWMAVITDRSTNELDQQEQSVIKRSPAPGGRGVKVSFILPRDGSHVSVVGDFNDWDPFAHPLRPRSNGTRSVALTLPAGGRYAFRYLSEGGRWHDDAAADAFEPNGAGGFNSVLET
jgi:Carbohydrate-binding module 48 (Isoamylase N-terminal domain)